MPESVTSPETQAPDTAASVEAAVAEPNTIPTTSTHAEAYQQLHDQYIRLAADFENFRKRQAQEQQQLRQYGAERTVLELLPALDNLERATASLSETSEPKLLFQSFRLVYNQLLEALQAVGIQRIEAAGKPFDPALHEAVSQTETADQPEDTVVMQLQTGYLLHDRVVRPARVSVAKAKTTPEAAPENPFSAEAAASSANSSFSPES